MRKLALVCALSFAGCSAERWAIIDKQFVLLSEQAAADGDSRLAASIATLASNVKETR